MLYTVDVDYKITLNLGIVHHNGVWIVKRSYYKGSDYQGSTVQPL